MSGIMPRHKSNSLIICKLIYRIGPITIQQGIANHSLFGSKPSDTREVYSKSVAMNYLREVNGVFSLSAHVKKHLDDIASKESTDTVQQVGIAPMYRKPFAEMPVVKRDPRLRDFHPVVIS